MTKHHTADEIFSYHIPEVEKLPVKSNLHAAALAMDLLDQAHVPMAVVNQVVQLIASHVPREGGLQRRIIMTNPYPETTNSLFPMVNITAIEAEQIAAKLGGRLPTSNEYDELFKLRPWPHLIYEWTSVVDGGSRVVRGGARDYGPSYARASDRDWSEPAERNVNVGSRVVKMLDADEPVPEGWIELPGGGAA